MQPWWHCHYSAVALVALSAYVKEQRQFQQHSTNNRFATKTADRLSWQSPGNQAAA
jgi:hypothetical protein